MTESTGSLKSEEQLQEMVAETETGARNPTGAIPKKILFFVPLTWTLFQLWYASPLPFLFNIGVLNSTEARAIHLAFAVFLSYTAYPTFKSSPRKYIPVQDWIVGLVGAFCAAYLFIFYEAVSDRPGIPTQLDLIVAVTGLILLLEATRRALGPPLMVVAAVFIIYTFGGPYMPDVIAHKGASLVFCRARSSSGRPRQSRGGLIRIDRSGLRIIHCQRGHHRYLHDSPDEKSRV
jgi:TRAP-type uncharacterized transport system fused permease subunit